MIRVAGVFALSLAAAFGQNAPDPKDTSPHSERFIEANGIRLHCLDWGGDGEPLVLLTGYGATAHVFDALAVRFTDRFHVLAFTRRGRAPSERTPSGYDLETLTSDLQVFLDGLGLSRVHLAGHSFGGTEMTHFATLHPERVIRRLRAKPDKIIVDVSCGQPQLLEHTAHGSANCVVMCIDRGGVLRAA